MIATAAVRTLELISTVIVLALSITAAKWQDTDYAKVPAATGYNAFAGAWGLLFTLIGFAALFIASFPGIIMGALDFLTFIILLAGGIAYAVQLRGVNCNAANNLYGTPNNPLNYPILNGGIYFNSDDTWSGNFPAGSDGKADVSSLKGRCNTALADDAFLFIGCIAALAAGILAVVAHRRGGGRHAAV